MPTNSPERHINVQQWLNWVTMYAESWLTTLITVAIQIGTLDVNDGANFNENFLAKRIFDRFEAVEDEYFDEIYTPEKGQILLEQKRKKEIDNFSTKNVQEQQKIVEKIVDKSLAICHILLKLAKEASQENKSRESRKAEENGGVIEMIEFDDVLKNMGNNDDDITQTDTVDFTGNWV
ncbi:hypothetical protein niasHT_014847 [Heterodera trifolii]|uniref:Uncharacterized protein n=1 Tax=Heterodera trifolii TaxID=157864 RepID=A0ABD2L6N9_9BILA